MFFFKFQNGGGVLKQGDFDTKLSDILPNFKTFKHSVAQGISGLQNRIAAHCQKLLPSKKTPTKYERDKQFDFDDGDNSPVPVSTSDLVSAEHWLEELNDDDDDDNDDDDDELLSAEYYHQHPETEIHFALDQANPVEGCVEEAAEPIEDVAFPLYILSDGFGKLCFETNRFEYRRKVISKAAKCSEKQNWRFLRTCEGVSLQANLPASYWLNPSITALTVS